MGLRRTPYDEVPYPSYAYAFTHPDNLVTVARMVGRSPAPVQSCRLLELGCASGGNLLPMAAGLPGSQFVGVDRAANQIEAGRREVERLGLSNLDLRWLDIESIGADLGAFDFIVCHGVYSWVSDETRRHVLRVCRENLVPAGVACISYNVYPGWYLGEMLRAMMRYHTAGVKDRDERIGRARQLLDQLARFGPQESPAGGFARAEQARLEQLDDAYLLYEYLAGDNRPVFFHQFVEQIEAAGLTYLGNAWPTTMRFDSQSAPVAEALAALRDPVQAQQYFDFFVNRRFRATLLGHPPAPAGADAAEVIPRHDLFVRGRARPDPVSDAITLDGTAEVRTEGGESVRLEGPLPRVTMSQLSRHWPAPVAFSRLSDEVARRLEDLEHTAGGAEDGGDVARHDDPLDGSEAPRPDGRSRGLARLLGRLYFSGAVELHSFEAGQAAAVGRRPECSRVARRQAEVGPAVTNLWHVTDFLDPFMRAVVRLLDGDRELAEVAERLRPEVEDPESILASALPESLRGDVDEAVDMAVRQLCDLSYLVAPSADH